MGTTNISKALGVLVAIPASLLIAFWIMTNPTGSISGLSKLLTIVIAFIALVNPKKGIFFVIPQILYTDEIKRLAVAYGAVSYSTVYEVLLGPIISVIMLNAGYLSGVVFGRYQISRNWILSTVVIGLLAATIAVSTSGSLPTRAQTALNVALYMTLVPLMGVLFTGIDEARKVMKHQIWWALPSIAWGIWQYFNGFNGVELDYARTGLSPVHFAQVFGYDKPRPFGFFGSATGYSCVGVYGIMALYYCFQHRRFHLLYLLAFLVCAWGIYAFRGRGLILQVPLVFFAAWCFFSRVRTVMYYSGAIVVLLSGIIFADKLLYGGLEKVNQVIATNTPWGREVLNVSTFSERLKGWILLSKPSTYSVFGNLFEKADNKRIVTQADRDFHHDVITTVILQTGVVGLLCSIGLVFLIIHHCHRELLSIRNRRLRWEASMALGAALTIILISVTSGNIFSTNPLNFQIWTLLGMLVVYCKVGNREEAALEPVPPHATQQPISIGRRPQLPALS